MWCVPVIVSATIFAYTVGHQPDKQQGDYDFTPMFQAITRLAALVVALLAIWMLYFIWVAITGKW